MAKSFRVVSKSAFLVLFAFSAMPLFAQHGGGGGGHMGGGGGFHGGGGGGFHGGGGGFHGGGGSGGFHSGGGFRGGYSGAPAAGYGAPRASGPPSFRSGGNFASRPGYGSPRPGNAFAGGNRNSSPSAPGANNGQWHSFGPPSGGRGGSPSQSAGGSSGANSVHALNGNRPSAPGAVRSFSGQGRQVWENGSASQNVVSRSQSLSTMHNSLSSSLFTRQGLGSTASRSGSAHFTSGAPLLANRSFSGVNASSNSRFRNGLGFNRFGHSFGGWRGCWNCGFGFGRGWGWGWGGGWGGWGLGFGWGWPWWGWDPFWYDSWWGWGSPAAGYGYYGPANNYYIYNYDGSNGTYGPEDNSAPPPDQENQNQYEENNQGTPAGDWIMPNGPSPSLEQNSSGLAVPVLIYMKSGSVITVRDYWMIDNVMHYIQMNGAQRSVDLDLVDLARTNTENAKSGVKFIFKSEPNAQPQEENPSTPPARPDSSRPGASLQPEART